MPAPTFQEVAALYGAARAAGQPFGDNHHHIATLLEHPSVDVPTLVALLITGLNRENPDALMGCLRTTIRNLRVATALYESIQLRQRCTAADVEPCCAVCGCTEEEACPPAIHDLVGSGCGWLVEAPDWICTTPACVEEYYRWFPDRRPT